MPLALIQGGSIDCVEGALKGVTAGPRKTGRLAGQGAKRVDARATRLVDETLLKTPQADHFGAAQP